MTPQENVSIQREPSKFKVADPLTKGDPTLIGFVFKRPDANGKVVEQFESLARAWSSREADDYVEAVMLAMARLAQIVRSESSVNRSRS